MQAQVRSDTKQGLPFGGALDHHEASGALREGGVYESLGFGLIRQPTVTDVLGPPSKCGREKLRAAASGAWTQTDGSAVGGLDSLALDGVPTCGGNCSGLVSEVDSGPKAKEGAV